MNSVLSVSQDPYNPCTCTPVAQPFLYKGELKLDTPILSCRQIVPPVDRLVTLLDTGSNASVRRTAAQQLGDIAKAHPQEVISLMQRVCRFLKSNNWETRTAASWAIEAIVKHVPVWQPGEVSDDRIGDWQEECRGKLVFDEFDIDQVLQYGRPLLASSGNEYDVDYSTLDSKSMLIAQKNDLKKRLGLGGQFMQELLDDEDLILVKETTKEDQEFKRQQQIIDEKMFEGLSSREKNRLKRKQKFQKKNLSTDSLNKRRSSDVSSPKVKKSKLSVTEQPLEEQKIVVESFLDNSLENEDEWPFEWICSDCCVNLLDVTWSIRHGAALGLKALLQYHGASGGKQIIFTKEENEKVHEIWLNDIALRLISVLALDRFADFNSDQMVAPVRETCSQALGIVMTLLDQESIFKVKSVLLKMAEHSSWEIRLGGLLGLKYLLVVKKDMAAQLLPMSYPLILSAIVNGTDEVRAVASESLVPISDVLVQLLDIKTLDNLIIELWNALDTLDDLTCSTSFVLELISNLYSLSVSIIFKSEWISRLYPFFRYPVSNVRIAVLKTCRFLMKADWLQEHCTEIGQLIVQTILIDENLKVIDQAVITWNHFMSLLPSKEKLISLAPKWVRFVLARLEQPIVKEFYVPDVSRVSLDHVVGDVRIVGEENLLKNRLIACRVIGSLLPIPEANELIQSCITGSSWLQTSLAAVLIQQNIDTCVQYNEILNTQIQTRDIGLLHCEMQQDLMQLRMECLNLLSCWTRLGAEGVPHLDTFDMNAAKVLITTVFDKVDATRKSEPQQGESTTREHANSIQKMIDAMQEKSLQMSVRTISLISGAILGSDKVPEKISPIVRSLMNSVKLEEYVELQKLTSLSLCRLLCMCHKKQSADKIIRNIVAFLTCHLNEYNDDNDDGILTLVEKHTLSVSFRGATLAIQELNVHCKASLFEMFKTLHSIIQEESVEAYQTLAVVIPDIDSKLMNDLSLEHIKKGLQSTLMTVRYSASCAMASFAKRDCTRVMYYVIEHVIPMMNDSTSVVGRKGSTECVYRVVEGLGMDILPFSVFLAIPLLGRMSDYDACVRNIASQSFGHLIQLLPLEMGVPDAPDVPEHLLTQRVEQRLFLEQLLDSKKVKDYPIPVKINAELRKYQQQGVNWLAFLNRYRLHGILCDDMGLGKTLQTICILASDHHERKTQFEKTKSVEFKHLPSLVVCPPSILGHWLNEIKDYCSNLVPVALVGSQKEKKNARIISCIDQYDVIVTSYDVLRNEIEFLSLFHWNYCVLDEGHVIKNARTKSTMAVKAIKANHRLILSGTPIQNNVYELWSLFDFLMPGFLGTEKQFAERYGKPIQQSRDAKSNSKEQEAGALALESLHRQVLPFLLRRMKEDVLQDLPPKIIQDHYCELSDIQVSVDDNNNKTHVFKALQLMKKICSHPLLVQDNNEWRDLKHSPKLLALKQLLTDCGIGSTDTLAQHRVLIFCQLKSMLDIIERDLFKTHMPSVSYLRLDGTVDVMKRHDIVRHFNQDPSVDVLLLTTPVGGLGLNLTGADTVIFMEHDWNPMKDLQAMDRAHRIGQKKTVNVYRFISKGTIEEKIMGLQRFKLAVANTIVNQQNAGLDSMNTDEIFDLFSTTESSKQKTASDKQVSMSQLLKELEDEQVDENNEEYNDFDLKTYLESINKSV